MKLFVMERRVERGARLSSKLSPEIMMSPRLFVRLRTIPLRNERLTVLKGNAADENELFESNAKSRRSPLDARTTPGLQAVLASYDSALATARAMKRSGVKRLVILSAAAHFPGIPNRIVSFVLRNHMRDSRAMEEIVQ